MATRTFREKSISCNGSSAADLHHDPGDRSGRTERRRLRAHHCFERSDDRLLWRDCFRGSRDDAFFWPANRERLCWRSSACALLPAHACRNLSPWVTLTRYNPCDFPESISLNSGGQHRVTTFTQEFSLEKKARCA